MENASSQDDARKCSAEDVSVSYFGLSTAGGQRTERMAGPDLDLLQTRVVKGPAHPQSLGLGSLMEPSGLAGTLEVLSKRLLNT